MYLKNIVIKNYGAVENLSYVAKFNEDNTPKPIIFVGKNGTGKTLLLSNIVHSFIELKRKTVNELQEVEDDKYFRVCSKSYIKYGENYYYIDYNFSNDIHFSDLAINNYEKFKSEEFNSEFFDHIDINNSKLQKEGFFNYTSSISSNIFEDYVFLYFPIDRYYNPAWINTDNNKLDFTGYCPCFIIYRYSLCADNFYLTSHSEYDGWVVSWWN